MSWFHLVAQSDVDFKDPVKCGVVGGVIASNPTEEKLGWVEVCRNR